MLDKIEYLKQVFDVKREIKVKYDLKNSGDVIFIPNSDVVELVIPPDIPYFDLIDLFGVIKLGEIHYLLATFYFQKDLSKEEEKYARMFYILCNPLQDVWSYKMIKKYLSEKEYEEVIEDLIKLYEDTKEIVVENDLELPELINRRLHISIALILEKTANVEVNLIITGKYKKEWEIYLFWLRHYADLEPNPEHYIHLTEKCSAPYRVKIRKDNSYEYFEVKKL